MTPGDQDKLERFVHRALRELPDRRAPRTLEQRVLARLGQAPEFRGFLGWSAPAKAAFLFASGLAASGLAVLFSMSGGDILRRSAMLLGPVSARFGGLTIAVGALRESATALVGSINHVWLYGGLVALAVSYAAVFGIGTAAYRAIRQHSS